MDYYALPCLEQGSITYSFLSARAMYPEGKQMILPLQNAILRFDLRCVGFDMTTARVQISDAGHALGVHLLPHTMSRLLVRFQQATAGAPYSDLHVICGGLLGNELKRGQDMYQPGCLKRLLAMMEILEARAMDDRMNGRDTFDQSASDERMQGNNTFDQPALDLSPSDTNVPRVTALAALTCGNLRCRRGGLGERAHSGENCILVLTGCPPGLG